MLCKRLAPTILALLLPLSLAALTGTLLSVGCGGSNDIPDPGPPPPPPLGTEADITGLSLSAGELSPPFSPKVNNYTATVGHAGEASIAVTVTLKDPRARLTINNTLASSGAQVGVPISDANGGVNAVSILVTSEDGRHSNSIALTLRKLPLSTSVWVLNGISGVPVEDTVLRVTEADSGKVLADNIPLPRAKNGSKVLALEHGQRYNIFAGGTGVAQACFANFDPSKEDAANLYCQRTNTTFYELEAPIIEEIAFATLNSPDPPGGWKVQANSAHYQGPLADVAAVRVTILTRNLAGTGVGGYQAVFPALRINIDETASGNTGAATGATGSSMEINTPVSRGGVNYYRTTYRFTTPMLTALISEKSHYLSAVAYDNIGNRTEQRVYLTITDSVNSVATDPDLSGVVPEMWLTQGYTYVGGGDLASRGGEQVSAMDPADPLGYSGYQGAVLSFYVRTALGGGTNLGVRGYEMWRSNGDDRHFVKILTVNYATLTTGNPFTLNDRTPSLVEGDVYYRVRVFNGNPANGGYSQFGTVLPCRVMPPTIATQAASHKVASDKLWPEFRVALSNPRLLEKDPANPNAYSQADVFVFSLFIKNTTNQYPFLMVPFAVYFDESDLIDKASPNAAVNTHRYGFRKGRPTVAALNVTGFQVGTQQNNYQTQITAGSWLYASDGSSADNFAPYAYLDDDGSFVINTDSPGFRARAANAIRAAYSGVDPLAFLPGTTYVWSVYGLNAGITWSSAVTYPMNWTNLPSNGAAYLQYGSNANDAGTPTGLCWASHPNYVMGSPEGWFSLIINPDAY